MSWRLKLWRHELGRRIHPNGPWAWLADRLPRRLAYFAAIRVGVNAITGPWEDQVVPELTLGDALQRWDTTR
jgi:hypothetical protein